VLNSLHMQALIKRMTKMKLKIAREIVEKKLIIYPENVEEIERKIKVLRKQADKKRNPETANRFRDKAAEFEAILKANFWNCRKSNEQT